MNGFWTSATRALEVCSAAIAEARVATLREVFRFGAIASVKRNSSGTLRFRFTQIGLSSFQSSLLPGALLQSLLNLANVRSPRPLATAAEIGTLAAAKAWAVAPGLPITFARLQYLLATTAAIVEFAISSPGVGFGEFVPDRVVAISHTPPVRRIMIPFLEVAIDVEVAVDIDIPVDIESMSP